MIMRSGQRGSALVLCLLILAAMSVIVLAFLAATSQRRDNAEGRSVSNLARSMAQFGQIYFCHRADAMNENWTTLSPATSTSLGSLRDDYQTAGNVTANALTQIDDMWAAVGGEWDTSTKKYNAPSDDGTGLARLSNGAYWQYGPIAKIPAVTPVAGVDYLSLAVVNEQPLLVLDKKFRPVPMKFDSGMWKPDTSAGFDPNDIRYIGRYALAWTNLRGCFPVNRVRELANVHTYLDAHPTGSGITSVNEKYGMASLMSRDPDLSTKKVGDDDPGQVPADSKKLFDHYRTTYNAFIGALVSGGSSGKISDVLNGVEYKASAESAAINVMQFPAVPYRLMSGGDDLTTDFKGLPGTLNERFRLNPFGGSGTDIFGWSLDNRIDVYFPGIGTASATPPVMAPIARLATGSSIHSANFVIDKIQSGYVPAGNPPGAGDCYMVTQHFEYGTAPSNGTDVIPNKALDQSNTTSLDYSNDTSLAADAIEQPLYLPAKTTDGRNDSAYFDSSLSVPAYTQQLGHESVKIQNVWYHKPIVTIDINSAPRTLLKAMFEETLAELGKIRMQDPLNSNLFDPTGTAETDIPGLPDADLYPLLTNKYFKVGEVYYFTAADAAITTNVFTGRSAAAASGTPGLSTNLTNLVTAENDAEHYLFKKEDLAGTPKVMGFFETTGVDADTWAGRAVNMRGNLTPHEFGTGLNDSWVRTSSSDNAFAMGTYTAGNALSAKQIENLVGRIMAGIWEDENGMTLVDILVKIWLQKFKTKIELKDTGVDNRLYMVGDLPVDQQQLRRWALYHAQRAYSAAAAKLIARNDLFRVVVKGQVIEGAWDTTNGFLPSLDDFGRAVVVAEDNLEFVYLARQENPMAAYASKNYRNAANNPVAGNEKKALPYLHMGGNVMFERWFDDPR